MLPENFIENIESRKLSQVASFFKVKDRPRFETYWTIINEIKPVDIYCYLKGRFGTANGFQNIFRNDSSDNLVHWDWFLKSGNRFIMIQGLNYRTDVWITGPSLSTEDKNAFIEEIKKDFSKNGHLLKKVRSELEHWTEFVNPYMRVRQSVKKLMNQIDQLEIDMNSNIIPDIADSSEYWKEQSEKYSKALGYSFGVRSMLPVMAESFVNLVIYMLLKSDIKGDARLKENAIRQPIDIRIKSLHLNCNGFRCPVDYTTDVCKNYHSLVNDRNDLLHGNVVIEKLKFNDLYFSGRVPIFKKYSTMWERAYGIDKESVGLSAIKNEFQVVQSLIEYIFECMDDRLREKAREITESYYLGINSEDNRLGVLFASWLVDMRPQSNT